MDRVRDPVGPLRIQRIPGYGRRPLRSTNFPDHRSIPIRRAFSDDDGNHRAAPGCRSRSCPSWRSPSASDRALRSRLHCSQAPRTWGLVLPMRSSRLWLCVSCLTAGLSQYSPATRSAASLPGQTTRQASRRRQVLPRRSSLTFRGSGRSSSVRVSVRTDSQGDREHVGRSLHSWT